MVRIEKITTTVEEHLDDFYKDRDRFKNMKMLLDFSSSSYDASVPDFSAGEPKFKKKMKASKFIRPKNGKKGLF